MAKLLTNTRIYGTGTVDTRLFVNGNISSHATNTGALQVLGGIGVSGSAFFGGTVTATNFIGNVSGASGSLAGGTAGQVPYQVSPGLTSFYGPGTIGQILISQGTSAPLYVNTSSFVIGIAANLLGGSAGQFAYQTAPHTTAFISTGSMYVGNAVTATNVRGGTAGDFVYQSAPGVTAYINTGSMYVGRAALADALVGGSGNVNTVQQTANASYYLTFVDSNNSTPTAENVFTTSSFTVNPSTGNVGIGTTSPQTALHISSLGTAKLRISADTDNITEADVVGIELSQDGGITTANFGIDDNNHLVLGANSTTAPNIYIGTRSDGNSYVTATDSKITILNNGNVGIGGSPSYKLDVSGVVRAQQGILTGLGYNSYISDRLQFAASTGFTHHQFKQVDPGSGQTRLDLRRYTGSGDGFDGGEMMTFLNNGNVGIGLTNPARKLQVAGDITINTVYKDFQSYSGTTNNLTRTWDGVLVAGSDSSGSETYTVIETAVPQDSYMMGGFTIDWFENYASTAAKTSIQLGGYWNAESNGGFIGWEYTSSNPNVVPTIQVGRKTSNGNTVIILSHFSANYPVIVARDLWLGYSGGAENYGTGWAILQTSSLTGYTNLDPVVARTAQPAGSISGTQNYVAKFTSASTIGNSQIFDNGTYVGVNTTDFSYTSSDNTPIIGSNTTNRFFVNGSLQLLNNNDAIVIGRGTATFLKDEELGFGWGGGWYMEDATWVRVRNNKNIYGGTGTIRTDGDMRAPIFYDQDNTGYYTNPASTSALYGLRIYNSFDTSSSDVYANMRVVRNAGGHANDGMYIGYANAGTGITRLFGGGSTSGALEKHAGYTYEPGDFRAPIFYDSNDTTYFLDPNSTSNLWVAQLLNGKWYPVNNGSGNSIDIYVRPDNNGTYIWRHIYGGSGTGYGTGVGGYGIYCNHLGGDYSAIFSPSGFVTFPYSARSPIFYDSNDTAYYLDPNSTSNVFRMQTRRLAANPDGNTSDTTVGTIGLWTNPESTTSTMMFKRTDQTYGTHGGVTDIYATYWVMDTTNRGWIFRNASTGQNIFSISNNNGITTLGTSFGAALAQLNVSQGQGGATTYRDIDLKGSWAAGEGHAISATHSTGATNLVGQMVFEHNSPGSRIKFGRLYHSGDVSTYPMNLISNDSSGNARLEMSAGSDMRSPIFYDTNNTGYYTDPNGTSRLSRLDLDLPSITAGITSLTSAAIDTQYQNAGGTNTWYPLTRQRAQYSSGYVTHVVTGLYKLASGGWGGGSSGWFCAVGGNDSYPTQEWRLTYDGYVYNSLGYVLTSGSFRAPIFYDLDNTGYYLDPTSTTSLRTVGSWRADSAAWDGEFSGKIQYHSNHWYFQSGNLWLFRNAGGSNVVTFDQSGNLTASGFVRAGTNVYTDANYGYGLVGVYTSVRYQGVFAMGDAYKLPADGSSTGNLYGIAWSHPNAGGVAGNLNTHGALILENGTWLASLCSSMRAASDMRAPIFYDQNNTGYYLDPNADLSLKVYGEITNSNYAEGNLQPGALNIGRTDLNYGWDGTSWASDIRAGILANCSETWEFVIHDSGDSVESVFRYDGGDQLLMGRDIGWGTLYIQAARDFRAPIFYDSNDTGYYLDPNGTSVLWKPSSATSERWNAHWRALDDGNWRPNITGDSNYWTNTRGWGMNYGGWGAAWKYGFCGLDIWGTSTDHPQGSGYVHAQGIQSGLHYATSDGGSAYGWQMVGAADATANRYWARGKWGGGISSWQEFVMSDKNVGYTLYANILYDSNDTGYYTDPNSTSVLNYTLTRRVKFIGEGGNSGMGTEAYAIFQEGGGWSFPYPDLRIAFHTGIKFGANPSYEGMRFYTDYDMSSRVMQVNGSSNYIFMDRWIGIYGHQGIYAADGLNGAHIYPNNGDYGSWRMDGTRNGWHGIYFASGSTLMMNDGEGGIHRSGNGWRIYHSGNDLYARGNITAYWSDRRLKQNIKPLEKGSGIDLIDKLIPSSFEWNALAVKVNEGFYEGQAETALIAQEVQEILPIAVVENKAGRSAGAGSDKESYLTIKYDKITPFIIQAVKDLKQEIDDLKAEIQRLKGQSNNGID
jgi:hypothetical protein